MELMELVEHFAFGVAVKDAKEEIEKYRDILDDNDNDIDDKLFFAMVNTYIVDYKNKINNLDNSKLINDYSFKRALKTYRELFRDTDYHPNDVFNELIKQICLQKSCFDRCDCSDNAERKEIVKFLGKEDTVKFISEALNYWKNMYEPGYYLFFIGFCLGMMYMGDDRITFDLKGWFDKPGVTGKFIHDLVDELVQIDEIYAERVDYENKYLSLCEIEDRIFEEKSKRVFELADKMGNGTKSEKTEIQNDMFKFELEMGGISSKRVDAALERMRKACINYYGGDMSREFEWKLYSISKKLYRLNKQSYSIMDVIECFEINDNVDGLKELFDEEKINRENYNAQMLIFLGHVYDVFTNEFVRNNEVEKLIRSDERYINFFNRLVELYFRCECTIEYSPHDRYFAFLNATLLAFSDEKKIQRFLKRALLELGDSLSDLIKYYAYDIISALIEFKKEEKPLEQGIRMSYRAMEYTALCFICGCLIDPEAYAPVANYDSYFGIYFVQNTYYSGIKNSGKEISEIEEELYKEFDRRFSDDNNTEATEDVRKLFVGVCEALGATGYNSRKFINRPFVTWHSEDDYRKEMVCDALALVEAERRSKGQLSLLKMNDRDLYMVYGLTALIDEMMNKIDDHYAAYPRYMDTNEPVKNELIKMVDLVLREEKKEEDNDDYLKEIADLRSVVKKLKSSYNSLYDDYKQLKNEDDKADREYDELRDTVNRQNKELDRLYELENKYNELLIEQNKTDYNEIERVLGLYKIMVAGGHSETARRLGSKYENMRFVSTVNEIDSSIRNMDYVFIIRRFNSHAMWQKITSELQGSDSKYFVIDVNSNLRQTEEAMYLHIVK
ncbi:MAG: hypothetical protein ACI4WM_07200 [Erysipelotrichaceae bacterium]